MPFHPAPAAYNELGFDVSYDPQSFSSLDAALQDCRRGRAEPADCEAKPIVSLGGFHFFSFMARWKEDGRPVVAAELLAQDTTDGKAWTLFWIALEEGFGAPGHGELYASPAGPLLRMPVRLSGTGAFNHHFHFLWRDGAWEEIDAQGWLSELKLPPGHGVWKGVVVDPPTFTARSSVWRTGDGNCCPSGGEVRVQLALRGRQLVIVRQSYRPDRSE